MNIYSFFFMLCWLLIGNLSFAAEEDENKDLESKITHVSKFQHITQELADQVAKSLSETRVLLEAISQDSDIQRLFETKDGRALHLMSENLTSQFRHAIKLRFLLPGLFNHGDSVDKSLDAPTIEMLRRAESLTQPVGAEVHFFNSTRQRIALVHRVQRISDKSLIGLIYLGLDLGLLKNAVNQLKLEGAYIELQQPIAGGHPVILARSRQGRIWSGTKPFESEVSGTRWKLIYWPQVTIVPSQGNQTEFSVTQEQIPDLFVFTSVSVMALLLLGYVLVYKRRSANETVTLNTAVYQGAVRAIMDGYYPEVEHLIPYMGRQNRYKKAEIDTRVGEDTIPNITTYEINKEYNVTSTEQAKLKPEIAPAHIDFNVPIISDSIFRAYDIRGIVGETLTEDAVYHIGRALGSEAVETHQSAMVVARDGRLSSPTLSECLSRGLRESGCNVIDVGMVPTPVLYYATHYLKTGSGVMLTGSHNPGNYNGLKIVLGGIALSGEAITRIRDRIKDANYTQGSGTYKQVGISEEYIRRITDDVPSAKNRPFKVIIDCGNGVPGVLAPQLVRALGHEVKEIYCEIDGNFPNHHPDPSQPKNLKDLIDLVKTEKADIGLAFDGDGDRLGVVDSQGNIIWPDRQMMLFAKDVLSRNPGKEIIYDVKCSRHLKSVIEDNGGKAVMWKTGHSLIKTKMRELNSPLAGEMSGHIFFKERWYGFDDALYAAARLLEILVKDPRQPIEIFAELPDGIATPELRLDMPESEHAPFMNLLIQQGGFGDAHVQTVDGLRVDYADAWGLIRASNTTPCLILRFEADDEQALTRIKNQFRAKILAIGPDLKLPF